MPTYAIIVIYKKALTLTFCFTNCFLDRRLFRLSLFLLLHDLLWSNCRRCLSTVKLFRIPVWEASALIYWMSYYRNLGFFAYSKYFIMKEFKTSTRNSRQTNLLSEIWQPLLSQLWESNTKTEFVFHISAMLVPA